MAIDDKFIKDLLRKIDKGLLDVRALMKSRGKRNVDDQAILAQVQGKMKQIDVYYQVAKYHGIALGQRLGIEKALRAEVSDLAEVLSITGTEFSGELVRTGALSVRSKGKREARVMVHRRYTEYFKKYALTFMLQFATHTYSELQVALERIKNLYKEQGQFYRNRPMTVLKKILNANIEKNIQASFQGRRSLPGDLMVLKPVRWKHLNPVYAKISGRNRGKPGSPALEAELLRRVPIFARVLDNKFKNSEFGNMRFFLKIATKYGRGTKWFWKVYSFYFGSDGVMFGGKTRRQKLRGGPGVTKRGYRTLYPKTKRGGKWPKRDQPARPFTLLREQDLIALASYAEEHIAKKWRREFAARASMRYTKLTTKVKVAKGKERRGWLAVALKER